MIDVTNMFQINTGSFDTVMQIGKELQTYDKDTYGLDVRIVVAMDGQMGQIGAIVTYDSMAQWETLGTKMRDDPKREQLFEKLFEHVVDGSMQRRFYRVV